MPPRVAKKKTVPIVEYRVDESVGADVIPNVVVVATTTVPVIDDSTVVSQIEAVCKNPQYIRLRAPKRPLCSKPSVCCFWCCHPHTQTPPIGLPIKFKNGVYSTIGQFCSLECASAFNFNSTEISHNTWESFHLLNSMARDIGVCTPVKQAPSRLSLGLFGGNMDIVAFRSQVTMTTVLPIPMVPVCQIMEEIHVLSPDKHDCVPLDNTRVQLAKNNGCGGVQKKDTINEKMRMGGLGYQEQSDGCLPDTIS